ncbi:MAG: protein-L-isoaspartate(D-aspartate) O-methyltransferase [Terriglobia bacterium]
MEALRPFELDRQRMVQVQIRRRGVRDERVLEALRRVPRHEFVPAKFLEFAYEDRPLPIGETETISQPYMVAAMSEAAAVQPGDKVLEVGCGSGYQAAILAFLGAQVFSMERNPALADSARARLARLGYGDVIVICGDGSEGYAPAAPYGAIVVAAGSPQTPPALLDQLAEGGRMVIPVGGLTGQQLQLLHKSASGISVRDLDLCQFVPLVGKYGWTEESAAHRTRG